MAAKTQQSLKTLCPGVQYRLEGNELTLVIDLNNDLGESKSGKSHLIATSNGNLVIPGATNGAVLGINCYRKK